VSSVVRVDDVAFDERGLVPAIVQDADTGEVLMLGYVDVEALRRALGSRTTWFWSRSRGEHWNKGATSGNVQDLVDVRIDCDGDAVLYLVNPRGPSCHTGERTCFHRALATGA
jgi:phosphoribosyl-AMP cyclohydrolase / phosphoribosyl-ATP pyrophosphohydrolase